MAKLKSFLHTELLERRRLDTNLRIHVSQAIFFLSYFSWYHPVLGAGIKYLWIL